ncbi:MAG: N-acetylmuramoyl-L-alanine amidase [Caldicoprobacterales bacterium]|nr:hypothetical protein [Clostridiales bacterium]
MAIKITVDPGHGRYGNPYPPRPGFYEGTQMWILAGFLKPELEKHGFQVITTRPKVTDNPEVAARGRMAAGHDLLVSLHSNAAALASDTRPTGSVVFYTMSTPQIKVLADRIGEKVSEVMGHYYRGSMIKESGSRPGQDYNGVLRNAIAAGCKAGILIEHGFHTNLKDSAFLIADENLKRLAIAEAETIAEYFSQKGEDQAMVYRTLRYGMSGEDVEFMQQFLKAQGYYTGPIDGEFGPGQGFLNSVKAFQQAEGLAADGVIGPATRARIINILLSRAKEPPSDDQRVAELEAELARYKQYFQLQNELSSLV